MKMPAKINDGLTNNQRFHRRHKQQMNKLSREWYHRNKERAQQTSKAWQLAHPDEYKAAKQKWRDAHPQEVAAINRAYYARHQARKAAEKREWRKLNPSKATEIKKRWMEKNPEKARESQVVRKARRRARELNAEGGFSVYCIRDLFARQCGLCFYCGISLADGYEIDHKMPLSKGGTNWKSNLALTCTSCNRRKHDKTEGWNQHWVHYQH